MDSGIEYVGSAWIQEMESSPGRECDLGSLLDAASAGLMENAVQEYDDVAVNETVSFDVVLGDESGLWSEGGHQHHGKRQSNWFGPEASI